MHNVQLLYIPESAPSSASMLRLRFRTVDDLLEFSQLVVRGAEAALARKTASGEDQGQELNVFVARLVDSQGEDGELG